MNILEKIQTVLDALLHPDGVYVFWQRKSEAGGDPDEYVVYTLGEDAVTVHADDFPLVRVANIAVRYYYRDSMLDTGTGRAKIRNRATAVMKALEDAGFSVPNGAFDAGDIDDIGFGTTIIECFYGRVL